MQFELPFLPPQKNRRILWPIVLVVLIGVVIMLVSAAFGKPPPNADPALSAWFKSQLQDDGMTSCCGDEVSKGGDGHRVAVERRNGRYFVYIVELEQWREYPYAVNPYLENETGDNIAWYVISGDQVVFYCLRLATGS